MNFNEKRAHTERHFVTVSKWAILVFYESWGSDQSQLSVKGLKINNSGLFRGKLWYTLKGGLQLMHGNRTSNTVYSLLYFL